MQGLLSHGVVELGLTVRSVAVEERASDMTVRTRVNTL